MKPDKRWAWRLGALLVGLALAGGGIRPNPSLAVSEGQQVRAAMLRQAQQRPPHPQTTPLSATPCQNGFAGIYPCRNVDLLAYLPATSLGGVEGNDSWGWRDDLTGHLYALMGLTNGVAFVDISDPVAPVYLGNLPTHTSASIWRDIKVFGQYAFVVSEAPGHGLQVFDLTQLRNVPAPPVTFTANAHYAGFSNAHNLVINPDSGYAFAVGTNTCAGGLHMVNLNNPLSPIFAGCYSSDGYTHDAQCVIYQGPDIAYQGHEVCFNANEDTLTIVDVTNKAAPVLLSRTGYSGSGYTHQGWLTPDHTVFLIDDELDELNFGHNTYTYIWDVKDLNIPKVLYHYTGATTAIDHNLYVHQDRVYEANYRAGLRILDAHDVTHRLTEVGYFDIYPANNGASFDGAWSTYPYYDSGVIIISGIESGLFVVQPAFELAVVPANGELCAPGNLATQTVTVDSPAGFSGALTWSVTDLPAGVSGVVQPDYSLTLTATAAATPGHYAAAVNGVSHSISQLATFNLDIVTAAAAPQLLSPANGASDQPLQPTLIWTPTGAVDHYTVEVARDAAFTDITLTAERTTPDFSPDGPLADDTLYYWRVRAHNACGPGPLSAVHHFRTQNLAPAAPALLAPADGAQQQALQPVFAWTAVSADTYTLTLALDPVFDNIAFSVATPAATYQPPTPLTPGVTYYWRVQAGNAYGGSPYSPVFHFRVGAPPGPPALSAPADQADNVPLAAELAWSAPPFAVSYTVLVATDAAFANLVVAQTTDANQLTLVDRLAPNTHYYWKVQAHNTFGAGPYSAVFQFTTRSWHIYLPLLAHQP